MAKLVRLTPARSGRSLIKRGQGSRDAKSEYRDKSMKREGTKVRCFGLGAPYGVERMVGRVVGKVEEPVKCSGGLTGSLIGVVVI